MKKISYKIALSALVLFSSINAKAIEPTTAILGVMAINAINEVIANSLDSQGNLNLNLETDRKRRILKAPPTWQYIPFSSVEASKGTYAMTAGVKVGDEKIAAADQARMLLRVIPNPEGEGYYTFLSSMNGFDCSDKGCRVGVKAGDGDWVTLDAMKFSVTGMESLFIKDQATLFKLIKSQKRLLFSVAQNGEVPTYWFINRKFNTNGIKFPE